VVGHDERAVADEGVAGFQAVEEAVDRQPTLHMDIDPRIAGHPVPDVVGVGPRGEVVPGAGVPIAPGGGQHLAVLVRLDPVDLQEVEIGIEAALGHAPL
jgi:hypothetical protein